MNHPMDFSIEKVQAIPDGQHPGVDKIGIKSIRHPVSVKDKTGGAQRTIAMFSMFVQPIHNGNSTNLSCLIEIVNKNQREISIENFEAMLREMAERLKVQSCSIEATFPYFINKAAPVSGIQSLMDYEVTIVGEICKGVYSLAVKVLVPVTSLCPCSKKISDYGAHNQRSHVTVTARINDLIWVEDFINLIEDQASCQLYGLLKREDEKYVTEYAYDNPKFVEDLVRDVSARLNVEPRIEAYSVECENFESIHNHSAYAVIIGD